MLRSLALPILTLVLLALFLLDRTLTPEQLAETPAATPAELAPTAVSRAPARKRAPTRSRENLAALARKVFESGDVCAYRKLGHHLSREEADQVSELIFESLLGSAPAEVDTSAAARALATEEADWASAETAGEHFAFVQALGLSNQLSGGRSLGEPDLHRALAMLESLRATDPGNGAYSYFRIGLLLKSGRQPHQLKSEFEELFRSPRFASQQENITRLIYERGLEGPLAFLIASSVRASLKTPDFSEVLQAIRELVPQEDDRFAEGALRFGRLVRDTQRSKTGGIEFVEWNAIEFQVGGAISKVAWSKLHPDETPPKDITEHYRDYLAINKDFPYYELEQAWSELASSPAENCGTARLQESLPEAKRVYFDRKKGSDGGNVGLEVALGRRDLDGDAPRDESQPLK